MKSKIRWLFFGAAALAVSFPLSGVEPKPLLPTSLPLIDVQNFVRVLIVKEAPKIEISTQGSVKVSSMLTNEILFQQTGPLQATVQAVPSGIQIGNRHLPFNRVSLESVKSIQVEGRLYKGPIDLIKTPANKLNVIQTTDLEHYLKGVLPLEVDPKWPMEALKAQAVASRTFALFKAIEKKGQDFVLVSTVQSQVYGGELFHHEKTDLAIDMTRGQVMTFGGNVFPAYFHSTCGGATAKASDLWPVVPNPVFQSVPCRYCQASKTFSWSLTLPLIDIEHVMQKKGYPASGLSNIEFQNRDVSGRARQVTLTYKRSAVTLSADDFRTFIGVDKLKSLKSKVTIQGAQARFEGTGWGHGIGMCQWGTKGLAEAGKGYREILNFYFPGSEIVSL